MKRLPDGDIEKRAHRVGDPGLDIAMTRSWPFLVHNLLQDLAALNKYEMVLSVTHA